MADSAVPITAGTGTNIDTRTEATNGNHRQVVVIGDPATNAGVAPVDATNGLAVYNVQALTVASHAVTNAGTFAVQATTGVCPRLFSVACTQLVRPANTTAYTAGDSISNNGTAGSVTALVSGNVSDTNDAPVCLTHIELKSSDTGLAGKTVRVFVFNSDYTASSGVGGGDNAAYSQKQAGFVGAFIGTFYSGISDGAVGIAVPESGAPYLEMAPVSGARTFYVNHQAVDAFTPSANSTTIDTKLCGFQGKAT